jgi:hypothetical protein
MRTGLIGALLFAAVIFASLPDAQASRRMHRAAQYKVYHFTGHHHANYVTPPYRFRKRIVPNSSYHPPRHLW